MDRVSFISNEPRPPIERPKRSRGLSRRQRIEEEYEGQDLLFADGFDGAIIGVTMVCQGTGNQYKVVYDYQKCINILIQRDEMTEEDAMEHLSYNTLDAYVGENTPIFMQRA